MGLISWDSHGSSSGSTYPPSRAVASPARNVRRVAVQGQHLLVQVDQ